MSILNLRKNKATAEPADSERPEKSVKALTRTTQAVTGRPIVHHGAAGLAARVLLKTRVTEKAHDLSQQGIYVFEVSPAANKPLVAGAVKELYKVTPLKVSIVKIPQKRIFVRGKVGVRKGGRKAYVYLKKGDKIE